jgi:hypothetical protein
MEAWMAAVALAPAAPTVPAAAATAAAAAAVAVVQTPAALADATVLAETAALTEWQGRPASWPVTFTTPGFYPFQCPIHGAFGMLGVVWVTTP